VGSIVNALGVPGNDPKSLVRNHTPEGTCTIEHRGIGVPRSADANSEPAYEVNIAANRHFLRDPARQLNICGEQDPVSHMAALP
jgi:hypothetical protein